MVLESTEMMMPPEFEAQTPGAFVMLFRAHKRNALSRERLQVLLVRRNDYDLWNLPGGGYDEGKEHEIDAAIREVKEETGLDVGLVSDKDNKMVSVSVFASPLSEEGNGIPGDMRHDRFTAFIGSILGGGLRLNDEARQIGWHDVKNMPENTYTKHATLVNIATGEPWRTERMESAIRHSIGGHAFIPENI